MATKINFQDSLAKFKDNEQPFSTGALYAFSNLEPEDQAKFEAAWPTIPLERQRRTVTALIELAQVKQQPAATEIIFVGLVDEEAGQGEPVLLVPPSANEFCPNI